MGVTLAVMNYKSGVGKTTLAAALAAEFANWGNKVLAVDTDAQAGLTYAFLRKLPLEPAGTIQRIFTPDGPRASGDDLLLYPERINETLAQWTNDKTQLALLPSCFGWTADLNPRLIGSSQVLAQALAGLKTRFNAVIIDCPPNFGLLTWNALVAADHVLIPTTLDEFALFGVAYSLKAYVRFLKEYNQKAEKPAEPRILGLVPTMVQYRDGNNLIPAQREKLNSLEETLGLFRKTLTRDRLAVFKKMGRFNHSLFARWLPMPYESAEYRNEADRDAGWDLNKIAREAAEKLLGRPLDHTGCLFPLL